MTDTADLQSRIDELERQAQAHERHNRAAAAQRARDDAAALRDDLARLADDAIDAEIVSEDDEQLYAENAALRDEIEELRYANGVLVQRLAEYENAKQGAVDDDAIPGGDAGSGPSDGAGDGATAAAANTGDGGTGHDGAPAAPETAPDIAPPATVDAAVEPVPDPVAPGGTDSAPPEV